MDKGEGTAKEDDGKKKIMSRGQCFWFPEYQCLIVLFYHETSTWNSRWNIVIIDPDEIPKDYPKISLLNIACGADSHLGLIFGKESSQPHLACLI